MLPDLSRRRLEALRAHNLLRTERVIDGAQGARVMLDGRDVLCACSNNYLGFAGDPLLARAAQRAMDSVGAGAAASRLISGTMTLHKDAERALARFVDHEAARLFSSGYAANVGCLQALVGRDDIIFSDALNHASIIDGCRLTRARIVRYPHADVDSLRDLLVQNPAPEGAARWIVTDGLFSMDGDRAPIAALRALADEHAAFLYVDEAHSLGVLGPSGRGVCAEAGVRPDVLIGTLGKAFGGAGAFVATDPDTADYIYNRARSFVFSTAPQPSLAASAIAACELVASANDRRARLFDNSARLRAGLRRRGFDVPDDNTPIVPVMVGDETTAVTLADALLERGVFVTAIRPPTVPPGTCRLRVVPIATHTARDIDAIIAAFAAASEAIR